MSDELNKKEASGMTVNERLYQAGLIDDFDEAVAQRNEAKIKSILEKIYFSPEDIQFMLKELLGSINILT